MTISISKILWPFKITIIFYYTYVPRTLLSSYLAVSHHECNCPHCIFRKMNFRHEQSHNSWCTFTMLAPLFVPKSKHVSIQAQYTCCCCVFHNNYIFIFTKLKTHWGVSFAMKFWFPYSWQQNLLSSVSLIKELNDVQIGETTVPQWHCKLIFNTLGIEWWNVCSDSGQDFSE